MDCCSWLGMMKHHWNINHIDRKMVRCLLSELFVTNWNKLNPINLNWSACWCNMFSLSSAVVLVTSEPRFDAVQCSSVMLGYSLILFYLHIRLTFSVLLCALSFNLVSPLCIPKTWMLNMYHYCNRILLSLTVKLGGKHTGLWSVNQSSINIISSFNFDRFAFY